MINESNSSVWSELYHSGVHAAYQPDFTVIVKNARAPKEWIKALASCRAIYGTTKSGKDKVSLAINLKCDNKGNITPKGTSEDTYWVLLDKKSQAVVSDKEDIDLTTVGLYKFRSNKSGDILLTAHLDAADE